MRRATITLVRTPQTRFPNSVLQDGSDITLSDIFEAAGIRLQIRRLNRSFEADRTTFNLEQLHRFMRSIPNGSGNWRATVLIVPDIAFWAGGRLERPLGVMFDSGGGNLDGPEREGCAVALSRLGDERTFVRTIAHELGHVFNLLHTSGTGHTLMHTTAQVRSASGTFPANIQYNFEPDDVQWLSHGEEEWVRPGGRQFRSRELPSDTDEHLRLEVSSRRDRSHPGEPIRLRYSLLNDRTAPLTLNGLPTLTNMRASVYASSRAFGRHPIHTPYYACDEPSKISIEPGRKLMWSECLPPDPRLDAIGIHELEVGIELDTDEGVRGLTGKFHFTRSVTASNDPELGLQLLRPWFRRAIVHGSVCPSSNDGQTATELLERYPDAPELDELRLCLAAGLRATGMDPGAILSSLPASRLDLEQRLQAECLAGPNPNFEHVCELGRQLGYPSAWADALVSWART